MNGVRNGDNKMRPTFINDGNFSLVYAENELSGNIQQTPCGYELAISNSSFSANNYKGVDFMVEMIKCACGCGELRPKFDKCGRERRYIGHHDKRGDNSPSKRPEVREKLSSILKMKYASGERIVSEETRRKMRENDKRGDKHWNWKGGRIIDRAGYILIKSGGHPRRTKGDYVGEHILVMEKQLGRFIERGEVVHHINEIKCDNRIENLMLLKDNTAHRKIHKEIGLKRYLANKCKYCGHRWYSVKGIKPRQCNNCQKSKWE